MLHRAAPVRGRSAPRSRRQSTSLPPTLLRRTRARRACSPACTPSAPASRRSPVGARSPAARGACTGAAATAASPGATRPARRAARRCSRGCRRRTPGVRFENRLEETRGAERLHLPQLLQRRRGRRSATSTATGCPSSCSRQPGRPALYLNEGGFRFRDVTDGAGLAAAPSVDHRRHAGRRERRRPPRHLPLQGRARRAGRARANELWINQGNGADGVPRFSEMARASTASPTRGGRRRPRSSTTTATATSTCFVINNSPRPVTSFGAAQHAQRARPVRRREAATATTAGALHRGQRARRASTPRDRLRARRRRRRRQPRRVARRLRRERLLRARLPVRQQRRRHVRRGSSTGRCR